MPKQFWMDRLVICDCPGKCFVTCQDKVCLHEGPDLTLSAMPEASGTDGTGTKTMLAPSTVLLLDVETGADRLSMKAFSFACAPA